VPPAALINPALSRTFQLRQLRLQKSENRRAPDAGGCRPGYAAAGLNEKRGNAVRGERWVASPTDA
jgi:hypothetical protein